MKNYILIYCLIFLVIGCTDSKEDKINNRDLLFIPINKGTAANTSEFIKSVEIVKLDTIAEGFIGKIDKIMLHKDNIYVMDKNIAASVKIFDKSGKYIAHIDKQFFSETNKSNGLLEFNDIDIFNDTLYILDGMHQKIYLFTLNGLYLKEKVIPFYAYSFAVMKWGTVFFKNLTSNRLEDEKFLFDVIVTNSKLEVINKFKPFDVKIGVARDRLCLLQPLAKSNDDVIYRQFFSDTIWKINTKTIGLKSVIAFEEKSKTEEIRKLYSSNPFDKFVKIVNDKYKNISIGGDFIIENNDFCALHFSRNSKPCWFFRNKTSGSNFISGELKFKDMLIPFPINSSNKTLVSVLDEARLENINYQESSPKFQKMSSDVIDKGKTYIFLLNLNQ